MKQIFNDKVLVLSSNQFKDDDSLITLVGSNGIFNILAKNVYKNNSKLKPLLIVGNQLDLEYTKSKDIFFAISCNVISDCSCLMKDYSTSIFLMFVQEISIKLFKYGDDFPMNDCGLIFQSLIETKDVLSSSLLFIGIIYKTLGIAIQTNSCVYCSNNHVVTYSLKSGGFICKNCLTNEDNEIKDKMDLYILKFSFSSLNKDILSKHVPIDSGKRVLIDLCQNLQSYFDINEFKTLDFLVNL